VFVVFPSARVLHTGDAFSGRTLAVIDANNGGSGLAYADTLERAAALPGIDSVIAGHGTATMTMDDLREHAQFVRQFVDDVKAARKAGRTVEDFVAAWKVPARFAGYAQPSPDRLHTNATVLWNELK
jgi:glyoxylase-like metal-dependent hydrolase (beta-lactamase superfamily II)